MNDGSLGFEAGGRWASGEEDGAGTGEETGSGETGEKTGGGRTDEKTGSGRAEGNGTTTADTLIYISVPVHGDGKTEDDATMVAFCCGATSAIQGASPSKWEGRRVMREERKVVRKARMEVRKTMVAA